MIRCALAEMRRLLTSTPRRLSPSISSSSTAGRGRRRCRSRRSCPAWRIPEGIRWNLNSSPSRTIVWPALLPPWKRTITSARSASRSVILPLPSSPHWAPTMTTPGMAGELVSRAARGGLRLSAWRADRGGRRRRGAGGRRRSRPGGRPCAAPICSSSSLCVGVAGDQHRALRLVALVDQRVELLEHPVGALLGAEVVDVEQVDRGEPLEEGEVGVARPARRRRSGGSGPAASAGSRSRRSGPPRAPPWRPASPASSCRCRCRPSARGPARRRGSSSSSRRSRAPRDDRGVSMSRHVGDRRTVEGDAAVARRDHRGDAARRAAREPLLAALAGARDVLGAEDPAGAVADASGQACSAKGSLRAIAGIRTQAPRRRRRRSAGPRRPAARSAPPGRRSRRISGSGRGRPASPCRSGRCGAWR